MDVLERCYEYLILVDGVGNNIMPLINSVRELIQAIKSVVEVETLLTSRRVRGRPRIEVDTEQLEYLVETGFRVKDIAEMLHCSKRTIERRMSELSLRASDYSCISEGDLDDKVSELLSIHRQIGEKMLIGHLRSQGHKIQRQRVRDAIRRVDPLGIELRSRTVLHRRTYCVKFPNSLWHLDGYHKLIRWKLVIHGGIDGFSRLVVFLKVSTNNYSRTVLSAFTSAVEEFGIPSRIRIDRGGENVMVTRWMLEHPHRGPDRHSVIAGRSVHNQRIERLWRDLFSSCVCFFYSFFYYLEDVGILNKDDSRDLTALHFLFVPLVQQQLDMFREGWAHHSLRTMNNRTPLQLWTLGLSLANSVEPGSSEVNGLLEVQFMLFMVLSYI